jgi:hypothetical protein
MNGRCREAIIEKANELRNYSYINNNIPLTEERIEYIRALCYEIENA